jgi:S-(hydroxymethyl)glutathione dehydrogenase/alcohol dehydrogenase
MSTPTILSAPTIRAPWITLSPMPPRPNNPNEVGTDKVVQAILDVTGGGADFSFDATGNVNVMRQGAAPGAAEGRALPDPAGDELERPGRNLAPGLGHIDDLITHTMPLDEINHGFDLMHEGKSIRSVVVY